MQMGLHFYQVGHCRGIRCEGHRDACVTLNPNVQTLSAQRWHGRAPGKAAVVDNKKVIVAGQVIAHRILNTGHVDGVVLASNRAWQKHKWGCTKWKWGCYGCRLGAGLFFKFRMPDAPR